MPRDLAEGPVLFQDSADDIKKFRSPTEGLPGVVLELCQFGADLSLV